MVSLWESCGECSGSMRYRPVSFLYDLCQRWFALLAVSLAVGFQPRLTFGTGCVHNFYGQVFSILLKRWGDPFRWPEDRVSALCRWCCPVGFIRTWSTGFAQHIQIRDISLELVKNRPFSGLGSCPKRMSSSTRGFCSPIRGKMEWEIGRLVRYLQWCGHLPVCRRPEKAEPKRKNLDVPVNLRSYPHLSSWILGHDQKNEITNTSGSSAGC